MSPLQNGSDLGDATIGPFTVLESSQVGEVRRAAMDLASAQGFGETDRGSVGIVATEVATNLIKHGGGGEVLLSPLLQGEAKGVQVLALDRGPGMADLELCMRDGFSTAGSPGNGLGALSRLSTLLHVHTVPKLGTAVLSRVWPKAPPPPREAGAVEVGYVLRPKPGESQSGDGWAVDADADRTLVLVVDGLGHGQAAADATRDAIRVFRENTRLAPADLVQAMHAALRSTRGAAALVVEVQFQAERARCAGVGNIAGAVFAAGSSRSLASHNGIVGHQLRKLQEFDYPFPRGALLILHSDGLSASWRMDQYAGLSHRHAAMVAGVLYRDFKRTSDDAVVVALREED